MKTIEVKKCILNIILYDKIHEEDDYDEIELETTIPRGEWDRLINEGMFSTHFENVIEGYKQYFKGYTGKEAVITFREIMPSDIKTKNVKELESVWK